VWIISSAQANGSALRQSPPQIRQNSSVSTGRIRLPPASRL